jgi:hypothetical protein
MQKKSRPSPSGFAVVPLCCKLQAQVGDVRHELLGKATHRSAHSEWATGARLRKQTSIDGHLDNRVAAEVRHPNVGSIEEHA